MGAELARGARVVDVQLLLPEDWWAIPLTEPPARLAAVRALVDRQTEGLDRPLLRADLLREVTAQVDAADAAGARVLALSLQAVLGTPVPAAVLLHWSDLPPSADGPGGHLSDLQESLLPTPGAEPPPGWSLDLARLPVGTVLRRVHQDVVTLPGGDTLPSVLADYWIERPDGGGVVQLAFSTPALVLREALLELFDAIAGSLRWSWDPRGVL